MIQTVEAFLDKVEGLQFAPAGLSLPVPAQKPTVPPTYAMFGLGTMHRDPPPNNKQSDASQQKATSK
jgi:hypothetical protein